MDSKNLFFWIKNGEKFQKVELWSQCHGLNCVKIDLKIFKKNDHVGGPEKKVRYARGDYLRALSVFWSEKAKGKLIFTIINTRHVENLLVKYRKK
jgi:hypothetical protein